MTVRCNGKQVVEGKLGRVCKPQSAGSPFSRSMISISLVPRYDIRFNAKSLNWEIACWGVHRALSREILA